MLRSFVARLRALDSLLIEADRESQLHEMTRLGQCGDWHKFRHEMLIAEYNARRFWWMRAKTPNLYCSLDGGGPAEPVEEADGDWVRHEDAVAAISRQPDFAATLANLRASASQLEATINEWKRKYQK
jgi:hypothetical protein